MAFNTPALLKAKKKGMFTITTWSKKSQYDKDDNECVGMAKVFGDSSPTYTLLKHCSVYHERMSSHDKGHSVCATKLAEMHGGLSRSSAYQDSGVHYTNLARVISAGTYHYSSAVAIIRKVVFITHHRIADHWRTILQLGLGRLTSISKRVQCRAIVSYVWWLNTLKLAA